MPHADTAGAPRVLLVTKGLDLGGIERVVTDLALGLHDRGVAVDVALVNPARDRLVPTIEGAGVTLHRLGGSDVIGLRAGIALTRLVRSRRYDVVHVHGPLPSALARVAALASKRADVVTTSHTPWHSLRRPTRAAWLATSALDAATVAVSGEVAGSLPRRAAERAVVIPHGIDPQRIAEALQRGSATRLRTDGDVITVVAVASHRDAKNYPNLLRALQHARDLGAPVRLRAIGDGPHAHRHVALATELGLADAVEFLPSTDDVLAQIAAGDLLVVASDYEGQPIVVAEALALGVPVVATAVGRVPEMVTTDLGRVVQPNDPAALGRALAELAGAPQLRAEMSGRARTQLHSWTLDDVVDAHLALYRRLGD